MKHSIAAVERDTGLSKDVLRMWERRYGFPRPERDAHGERLYPADQVDRLRQIKRLMDQGHRPGRLVQANDDELAQLAPRRGGMATPELALPIAPLLDLIQRHDTFEFRQHMQQLLSRDGLPRFVQDIVAPLTEQVGKAWMDGRIKVYEEHLYTEQVKRLLRQAIATLPAAQGAPRVLLTTPPEEQHSLGLLMVEALFAVENATCISLGTQTPLPEVVQAAATQRADVVALSISIAYPARQVMPLMLELRQQLPEPVALWIGGAAVHRLTPPPGVRLLHTLPDALAALTEWRQ